MRQNAVIVVIACGLGLAASVAGAQPAEPVGAFEPGPEGRGYIGRVLGLSAEQREAIRAAMEKDRPRFHALREEMNDVERRLAEALASENPEASIVGELAIEQHRLREKGRKLHEESKGALRTLLTAEQRAKLDMLDSLRVTTGPMGRRPGFAPRPGGRW